MELNLFNLLVIIGLSVVGGAFLGVLLGRRSSTANRVVDDIRNRYEREAAELRAQVEALRRRAQGQD